MNKLSPSLLIISLLLTAIAFLWPVPPGASGLNIKISQVDIENFPEISLYLSVTDIAGEPIPGIQNEKFIVTETRDGRVMPGQFLSIKPIAQKGGKISIILLLDTSSSMEGEKLVNAKEAVGAFFHRSPQLFSLQIASFNSNVNDSIAVDDYNYRDVLDKIQASGITQLFGALVQKLEQLRKSRGRKAIVVLTDGQDNVETETNKKALFKLLEKVNISVYTIGLGADADVKNLLEVAQQSGGEYHFSPTHEELQEIYYKIARNISNEFVLQYESPFRNYKGLQRVAEVQLQKGLRTHRASKSYYKGGITDVGVGNGKSGFENTAKHLTMVTGSTVTLLVILFLLAMVLPLIQQRKFVKKYVKSYRSIKNGSVISKYDTYSSEPFTDSTMVVTKCSHLVSVDSWKRNNHRCPEYPLRCSDGIGRLDYKVEFFKQTGIYKHLSWLWFGALAGVSAWILTSFFLEKFFAFIPSSLKINMDSNIKEMITGAFTGACLGFLLGFVEELQTRLSTYSIKKILARTIIGIFAGAISFLAGNLIFLHFLNSHYLGRLLCWLLLGSLIGSGLTIYSGSQRKNGMLGGVLGALIGFHCYYFCINLDIGNVQLGKLIGLALLGGFIGGVTSVVLSKLQEFYLKCMSDPRQGVIIPIGKWLKTGTRSLIVGKGKKAHVPLGWDSYVCEKHAKLAIDDINQLVSISPFSSKCTVLVNDRPISRKVILKNNDIITLGNTSLRYYEKRASTRKNKLANQ